MRPDFDIQIVSRRPGIPASARLLRWLASALPSTAAGALRVVNTAEARRLNRDFRKRDCATNVLTFTYGHDPVGADIILCAQVVAREARDQGKSLDAHYAHLTVHGALHAIGLDHRTRREAAVMEAREIEILGTLGFANPYVEPAALSARSRRAGAVAA